MCNEKGSDNLFSGILMGGLIGVALGIVFAPLAGEKTRNKIKEKLEQFDFGDIAERFSEAFDAGKEEFNDVSEKTEEE